jgi:hypothetical protein
VGEPGKAQAIIAIARIRKATNGRICLFILLLLKIPCWTVTNSRNSVFQESEQLPKNPQKQGCGPFGTRTPVFGLVLAI